MEGRRAYLLCCGRWPAGKTYEDAIRAAMEEQYLPTVPVPVHRMEIFTAEPDRILLKLPISGYVQAKSGSQRQWRKWIGAAALESPPLLRRRGARRGRAERGEAAREVRPRRCWAGHAGRDGAGGWRGRAEPDGQTWAWAWWVGRIGLHKARRRCSAGGIPLFQPQKPSEVLVSSLRAAPGGQPPFE